MHSDYSEFQDIEQILVSDAKWSERPDGAFRVSTLRHAYVVATESLHGIHPLLVHCIRELSLRNKELYNHAHVSGENIKSAITYLTRGTIDISQEHGQTFRLVDIYTFHVEPGLSEVIITGAPAHVTHTIKEGLSIPVVVTTGWATYEVPRTELEQRYPGWAQRLEIGMELGIDSADLIYYALQKPLADVAPVAINDVTFK